MLNLLENYEKPIKVNGKIYPDGKIAYAKLQKYPGDLEIELNFKEQKPMKTKEEYQAEIVMNLT